MTSEEKQSIYSLLKTVSSWTAGFIPAEYRTEPPVFTDDITVPAGVQTKAAEKPQQSSSLEQKPKTEETGRLTLDSLYKKISECRRRQNRPPVCRKSRTAFGQNACCHKVRPQIKLLHCKYSKMPPAHEQNAHE